MRQLAMVLSLVASTSVILLPGTAAAQGSVDWNVTISSGMPPPARYEAPPPPRSQYIWITGFWRWRDGAYIWMPARWEPARSGYGYVQPEWREGPRGWQFNQGGWKRGHPDTVQYGKHRDEHRGNKPHAGHCPPGQRKKGAC